jgi:hypothetical protein
MVKSAAAAADDWLYMTRGRINVTDGYEDFTAGKLSVLGSGTDTNATFMNTSKMVDNGFCSGMVQTSDGGIMGAGGHSAVSLFAWQVPTLMSLLNGTNLHVLVPGMHC